MAFGSPTGPPASAQQVKQLTALVLAAGHTDFRDARGPLGLTQRQAAGKFTRDEAEELIARLEADADADADGAEHPSTDAAATAQSHRTTPSNRASRSTASAAAVERRIAATDATQRAAVRKLPAEVLAAELQRRGWVVLEP